MSHCKSWTQEDIDYLESWFGKCHISKIATHLKRTEKAVMGKARRLGLNIMTSGGYVTMSELANCLNIDKKTVKSWFSKGLKHRYFAVNKQKMYFIDVIDFWKWAKQHQDLINFTKIERNVLIPEPDWLDEVWKESFVRRPKRIHAKWTPFEEQLLMKALKNGETFEQIAKELNRTVDGVKTKYHRLVEPKRIYIKWTDKEISMLMEMDKQGIVDREIALELGREHYDIKAKRKHLRSKGIYDFRKRKSSNG